MSGVTSTSTAANWLKDWQMYDIPINEESKHELLFSSQKSKTKDFKKHCCNRNVMLPHVQQQLTDKMQKDHQQVTQERDIRIQAIQYENVALQVQRDVYQA